MGSKNRKGIKKQIKDGATFLVFAYSLLPLSVKNGRDERREYFLS